MNYPRRFYCTLICIAIFLLASSARATEEGFTISGTLIIAFANANGLVVVTDSMQTRNQTQLAEPGQKLMKYDERTVCAIAGLGRVNIPAIPELSTQILGVIAAFRDGEIAQPKKLSFQRRLNGISGSLSFYLATISDVLTIKYHSDEPKDYGLELIMAGYDVDGKSKVGFLSLRAEPRPSNQGPRWRFRVVQNKVTSVDKSLLYCRGGIPILADKIMMNPEKYNSPVIKAWAKSKTTDAGASLTLNQLRTLGCELVRRTGKKFVEVGGECQTAVIATGKIQVIKQPQFDDPVRPIKLNIFSQLTFGDEGLIRGPYATSFITPPGVISLYEDSSFSKTQMPVSLDSKIFINCEFRNTDVQYDGRFTFLDNTDRVLNSSLEFGPAVDIKSAMAQHLIHDFTWVTIDGLPGPYEF